MTTHELKSWPGYFEPVWKGEKTFEIRRGEDREYKAGDEVMLREYFAEEDVCGRSLRLKITYVMHGGLWLPPDAWLFSFRVLPS